ncbi:unnamed protein product [Protopolystoma xenopodis]|uniref:Uncharacterized protein n=1 Tax=Protopolystoma xenopodis TaxID=117903 RepID=A0A3S5AAW4_9PLAT|nr:unnamed protein product [Protopolystoma xenopodis]
MPALKLSNTSQISHSNVDSLIDSICKGLGDETCISFGSNLTTGSIFSPKRFLPKTISDVHEVDPSRLSVALASLGLASNPPATTTSATNPTSISASVTASSQLGRFRSSSLDKRLEAGRLLERLQRSQNNHQFPTGNISDPHSFPKASIKLLLTNSARFPEPCLVGTVTTICLTATATANLHHSTFKAPGSNGIASESSACLDLSARLLLPPDSETGLSEVVIPVTSEPAITISSSKGNDTYLRLISASQHPIRVTKASDHQSSQAVWCLTRRIVCTIAFKPMKPGTVFGLLEVRARLISGLDRSSTGLQLETNPCLRSEEVGYISLTALAVSAPWESISMT